MWYRVVEEVGSASTQYSVFRPADGTIPRRCSPDTVWKGVHEETSQALQIHSGVPVQLDAASYSSLLGPISINAFIL